MCMPDGGVVSFCSIKVYLVRLHFSILSIVFITYPWENEANVGMLLSSATLSLSLNTDNQLMCTSDTNLCSACRFMIAIPSVVAPSISLHTSHPPPHLVMQQRHLALSLCHQLKPLVAPLHRIESSMRIHCPEVRLIQYDCGKWTVLLRSPSTTVILVSSVW